VGRRNKRYAGVAGSEPRRLLDHAQELRRGQTKRGTQKRVLGGLTKSNVQYGDNKKPKTGKKKTKKKNNLKRYRTSVEKIGITRH